MSEANGGELAPGTVFQGRYEVLRVIAAGGMGAVYEVRHKETRRRRALKVMLPSVVANADLRARFKAEAQVAADVRSDHIVETFDAGVDEATGTPFLVMELLEGEELAKMLAERGRLSIDETVLLLKQASLALDKTHAAGIVHRDLKPENLFVTRGDDGSLKIKILDFGIAKVVDEAGKGAAVATRSLGTPLYMAPEQIKNDGTLGPRSDLYALAHIAYTMLAGAPYWMTEMTSNEGLYGFLMRVATGAPEPASVRAARAGVELPPSFDGWFARATAVDPSQRFARATEEVVELARALGAPPPFTSTPVSLPTQSRDVTSARTSSEPAAFAPTMHETPAPMATPAAMTPGVIAPAAIAAPAPPKPKRSMLPLVLALTAVAAAGAVGAFFFFSQKKPSGVHTTTTAAATSSARVAFANNVHFRAKRRPGFSEGVSCGGDVCSGEVFVGPVGEIDLEIEAPAGTIVMMDWKTIDVDKPPASFVVPLVKEMNRASWPELLTNTKPNGWLSFVARIIAPDQSTSQATLKIAERALRASFVARVLNVVNGPVHIGSEDLPGAAAAKSVVWISGNLVEGVFGEGKKLGDFQLIALSDAAKGEVTLYDRTTGKVVEKRAFKDVNDKAAVEPWLKTKAGH